MKNILDGKLLLLLVYYAILLFVSACQKSTFVKYYDVSEIPSSYNHKDSVLHIYYKIIINKDTLKLFSFDETGQNDIRYYELKKPILGNDQIPYRHKMFLLPELGFKKDTTNQGLNQKETFTYSYRKQSIKYSSKIKMLTDPQLSGEIFISKDSCSLFRVNEYPFYPKTVEYLQIVKPADKDQIKFIDETMRKFLIEYEKL